jgi:hypothetical protein
MSLFNNPMVKNALDNMSQEMKNDYKQKGKKIHETIDFTTSKYYHTEPTELQNIMEIIKSGISLSDLDKEDVIVLKNNLSQKEFNKLKNRQM